MEKWLSIKEVDEQTAIPHQTIRRYIDRHGHHLKLKRQHNRMFIHEDSLEHLQTIRSWYAKNYNSDQVDELLVNQGVPMTIEYDENDSESVSINFPEVLSSLTKGMNEQREFNEQLLEHLSKQDGYMRKQNEKIQAQQKLLDENLAKRDEQLLEVIREIQETREQVAASREKKWWKFWE